MSGRSWIIATAEQRVELRDLAGSSDREEADRARAILLSLEGWSSDRIARHFACSRTACGTGAGFSVGKGWLEPAREKQDDDDDQDDAEDADATVAGLACAVFAFTRWCRPWPTMEYLTIPFVAR
jgi:hypothetical protein